MDKVIQALVDIAQYSREAYVDERRRSDLSPDWDPHEVLATIHDTARTALVAIDVDHWPAMSETRWEEMQAILERGLGADG